MLSRSGFTWIGDPTAVFGRCCRHPTIAQKKTVGSTAGGRTTISEPRLTT